MQADQFSHNIILPSFNPGTEKLNDKIITILVHNQARESIRFGMNQAAERVTISIDFSIRDGPLQSAAEEHLIYLAGLIPAPNSGSDLRSRAESSPRQEFVPDIPDLYCLTRPRISF
jgi:hypothetical protein